MHLGRKDVNDVKVGIFVGRFPTDGAESLTVERVKLQCTSLKTLLRITEPARRAW